ncbi:hypothetical protein [Halalkalibacter oceani]|uniref:hypothetical protein n=1 Tax=Halalkalibacter oceani TaxID=1653776 RepID=UPI0033970C53
MMVIVFSICFFTLFFGVMMFGNHMSHTLETIVNKRADEHLLQIEQQLKKN